MPHGRHSEGVLNNHHHKEQPPQLFPGNLAGMKEQPTSEVHGLCLESFLRQHLPH